MNTETDNYHTFFTHPWWSMGQPVSHECDLSINETATRARAGLLNMLSGTTIFLLLAAPELDPVRYVAPFVIFDMVTAAIFGLTPISPAGILGTTLTMKLKPVWKPKMLNGIVAIEGKWADGSDLLAIPYYARDNRINGRKGLASKVWIEEQ